MKPLAAASNLVVIIDGPIIELFSRAGIFAAAIPVARPRMISLTNSACTVYGL